MSYIGPGIRLPYQTDIYLCTSGTCTAAPEQNLNVLLSEIGGGIRRRAYDDSLMRLASGGGTVAVAEVRRGEGPVIAKFLVDLGDYDDERVFDAMMSKWGLSGDINGSFVTHAHPDHIAFRRSEAIGGRGTPAYISERDNICSTVLGNEGNQAYMQLRGLYERHRERGLTDGDFTRINPENPGLKWLPGNVTLLPTPGHDTGHMSPVIEGPVRVIVCETGEIINSPRGATFSGDCLCDSRYLQQALQGNPQSSYDLSFFDPPLGNVAQDLDSQKRIIEIAGEDGLIIPGHGMPMTVGGVRENPPVFSTTYLVQ